MKIIAVPLALSLSLLLGATFGYATEQNKPDSAPYVSIHVEVKELKESGVVLRKATENLAQSLNHASENINDLSPEQLQLINDLADKINHLTDKLNTSIAAFPETIRQAKEPSTDLLESSLQITKQNTIDPITDTIETWIILTVVGLCLLGAIVLLAVILGLKSINTFGVKLKDIADGYRVIPVDQYDKIKTTTRSD